MLGPPQQYYIEETLIKHKLTVHDDYKTASVRKVRGHACSNSRLTRFSLLHSAALLWVPPTPPTMEGGHMGAARKAVLSLSTLVASFVQLLSLKVVPSL